MANITGVTALDSLQAAPNNLTGQDVNIPATYPLQPHQFVLAYEDTTTEKTVAEIATGTTSIAYTYTPPLAANAGEFDVTVTDTVETPFADVEVDDVFLDVDTGQTGIVVTATSTSVIVVRFQEPPVQTEDPVSFVLTRETYAGRAIEIKVGDVLRTIKTSMTLAAILAAMNADIQRFVAVHVTGVDARSWAYKGPLHNRVVIDRDRILRGTLYGLGTYAADSVVGKSRTQDATPVGASQLMYDAGGTRRMLFISIRYSKATNPGSGVVTHGLVDDTTGHLAGYTPYNTPVDVALRRGNLLRVFTPLAGQIAGTAQPVPTTARVFKFGPHEEVIAV